MMTFVAAFVALSILAPKHSLVSSKPSVLNQIVLLEKSNSPLLHYPTQFTQNIVPKQIHSHNDYWRDVPLLSALSYGIVSVEADVWLVNETLHIGHEIAALTNERTFDALYVQPLINILSMQNPNTPFNANRSAINGVFDTSSGQTLYLFIDMKTDGEATFPYVSSALEPLRKLGYLTTYYPNGTLALGVVTPIGTGNTPLDQVQAMSPRDVFFDAPLANLTGGDFDATISPIASTDYSVAIGWSGIGNISLTAQTNLTQFVGDAHARGIKARFWDTPGWPIQARNNVWQLLLDNDADFLNADDLEAASSF